MLATSPPPTARAARVQASPQPRLLLTSQTRSWLPPRGQVLLTGQNSAVGGCNGSVHAAKSNIAAVRTKRAARVVVEVVSVELSKERAQEMHVLGSLFLCLSVNLRLGSIKAASTSPKRGSVVATWEPPERRELLWDG